MGSMIAGPPRRVLFVSHTSEWIGPNISLLELVTRMPEELWAVVAVPGVGRFSEALADQGIDVRTLARIDKYGVPALVRMIRREGVELVYGNSAHGASRNALIAAKFCNVPFVYHLREMAGPGRPHTIRLFSFADAAVAVSRAAAESYRGRFRRPPRVIHNGVSVDRFDRDRGSAREAVAAEFGIDPEAPLLIHVGNVYRRKGQLTALEVVRDMQADLPGCSLLMVGRLDRDPAYVQQVRETIVEYGLDDRAVLTGLRSDVASLLAAADVFLHTALEDPHPRAVIEAMAAGLPVVALDVDGVSETVVDGETGFLVSSVSTPRELAVRATTLLKDESVRRAMGESGRERTRKLFSAERTAAEVAELILGLIGPR